MRSKHLFFGLFVVLAVLLVVIPEADLQAQCAMCRSSLESSLKSGMRQQGTTINYGILYLLAMPYVVIGVVSYFWYKSYKKKQAQKDVRIFSDYQG